MEFRELIEARHSVRRFAAQDIEDDKLQKILHAANRAPSAGDLQAYSIVVARSASARQALASAAFDQQSMAQAAVVLVFLAETARAAKYGRRGEELYALQDATIACAYAQLAVDDLGLSSVWVGAFRDSAVIEAVGASAGQMPVAMLPIGYANETPPVTPRRDLSDLTRTV